MSRRRPPTLALALQELTGQTKEKVEVHKPLTAEETTLVHLARAYLRNGEDPKAKEGNHPPAGRAFAQSGQPGRSLQAGGQWHVLFPAAPSLPRQLDCTSLADHGFPAGTPTSCFLYRSFTVDGDTSKIFYPSA